LIAAKLVISQIHLNASGYNISTLEQFAEATDITQGETVVTVSCTIPTDLLPLSTLWSVSTS